mgnify:CR=1 FL=1
MSGGSSGSSLRSSSLSSSIPLTSGSLLSSSLLSSDASRLESGRSILSSAVLTSSTTLSNPRLTGTSSSLLSRPGPVLKSDLTKSLLSHTNAHTSLLSDPLPASGALTSSLATSSSLVQGRDLHLSSASALRAPVASTYQTASSLLGKASSLPAPPASAPSSTVVLLEDYDDALLEMPFSRLPDNDELFSTMHTVPKKRGAEGRLLDHNQLASLKPLKPLKELLVSIVGASLISEPDFFKPSDPLRKTIISLVEQVAAMDGEFVLKLALYTRDDLNIRVTANFLLALSAHLPGCRNHLFKYFSASIRLPSDWMEVAELSRGLASNASPSTIIEQVEMPTSLRKAMIAKFPQFDAYQLAKYDKEKPSDAVLEKRKDAAAARAAAAQERPRRGRGGRGGRQESRPRPGVGAAQATEEGESKEDDEEDGPSKNEFRCTLKYLIRQLHVRI